MILNGGVIINGEYKGWEVKIIDDVNGDTGGFYLILRNGETQSFDYWFEKEEFLHNQLADFDVKWVS
ncbi:hypothetical protein [Pantoea septica]|uniref:hypothetical protein n=1 Tax=Pantoea septica TaxID=472695 RepID=UPI003D051E13